MGPRFSRLYQYRKSRIYRQQQGGSPSSPQRRPNYEKQQQQELLNNRNNIRQPQGLTGILQRFLGNSGDRRKDVRGQQQQTSPSRNSNNDDYPRPVMTFQGPLPPVIATKLNSANKPNFGGLHRSDNVERPNPNVLDSYSASIINGGSLLGLPGGPAKSGITDAERAQLERFLFGPGEYFSPRGFISSETTDFAR